MEAFEETNVDPSFYANRNREYDEILPWDFIDVGVTKKFLMDEYNNALNSDTTPNCKEKCSNCGILKRGIGGVCKRV